MSSDGESSHVAGATTADGEQAGASERPGSILEEKEQITSQDPWKPFPDSRTVARKCACRSVWCPDCFIREGHSQRLTNRLRRLNWRSTRQVVLTVDPAMFKDGQEAHDHITKKHLIPDFVHNLGRTIGVQVSDYVWVKEFYRSGFPHWHVFIDVSVEGKAGMIGGDVIRHYWPWSKWVREEPIKSERHWNRLTGYFEKHGYFNRNKAYQARLPEWALDEGRTIRRYGGKCDRSRTVGVDGVRVNRETGEVIEKKHHDERPESERPQRDAHRLRLKECGQLTHLFEVNSPGITQFIGTVHVPYKTFRDEIPGHYVDRLGYVVEADVGILLRAIAPYAAEQRDFFIYGDRVPF